MRVLVVYESKYGNTKQVAETIVKGIQDAKGIETVLTECKDVDFNKIVDYDAILVGTPNHMGSPTRGMKKFVDKLGKLNLEGKQTAVFDTYIKNDFEKAVKKLENRIKEKVPGLKRIVPGLSIRVDGMKGPISEGELPKCAEFGKKLAVQMKGE
ncbi:MAG: flavodoxin family protein [Candidatus Heimdallarchaeota archaeon]